MTLEKAIEILEHIIATHNTYSSVSEYGAVFMLDDMFFDGEASRDELVLLTILFMKHWSYNKNEMLEDLSRLVARLEKVSIR